MKLRAYDIYNSVEELINNENGKVIINIDVDGFNVNAYSRIGDYTFRDNCLKLYGDGDDLEIEIDFNKCEIEYDEIEDAFYFIYSNGSSIVLQPLL